MNFKLIRVDVINNGYKLWLRMVVWNIFLIFLFIINYFYFNQNAILSLSILACFVAPWFFYNKILGKKYSGKIVIKLDYDSSRFFIIKNGIEIEYNLDNIKSYWIAESSNGYSTGLSFKFKSNNLKKVYFVIYNKKQSADQTDTEEVLESFQLMIDDYNKSVDVDKRITLTQTFAESVYGLISIYVLAGLIIIAVVLHIIYHQIGTLPISLLVGGGVLTRIIGTRQSDIKRRRKNENIR